MKKTKSFLQLLSESNETASKLKWTFAKAKIVAKDYRCKIRKVKSGYSVTTPFGNTPPAYHNLSEAVSFMVILGLGVSAMDTLKKLMSN